MKKLMLIGLMLSLGACDRAAVDEKNASTTEVAEAVSKAGKELKFNPGRWESTIVIESMDTPGIPAEVRQAMQARLGKEMHYASCLTKEQAEKPAADFFVKDAKNCTYDHFTMGSGKIDAKMRCTAEGRANTMTMNGAYDANRYDMAMETRVDGASAGPMTMKMKVASRRTGDCSGTEGKLN